MTGRVAIVGGGVAGLSAAHELVERGFQVTVYERRRVAGGKARSVLVPGSGTGGRADLPGEHGFRFFPGFYQHVTDTMKRIPFPGNAQGVFDNLVPAGYLEFARAGKSPLVYPTRFPRSLADLLELIVSSFQDTGLTLAEKECFARQMWRIVTSCAARRLDEYEKLSWWDFMQADRFSDTYRKMCVQGLSRSLVAARAEVASTRTLGDINLQMIFHMALPGVPADRLLNGPTSDVWIGPWLEYLRRRGVDYRLGAKVVGIRYDTGKGIVSGVEVEENAARHVADADHYLFAVPIEVMARLVERAPELIRADPRLDDIRRLGPSTAWMNGIQFYLTEDIEGVRGHYLYEDSPWSLTSVAQRQFWPRFEFTRHGDGRVQGILSVDISDWVTRSPRLGKSATECTREEIGHEVWAQLKDALNVGGREILRDDHLHSFFLDPDIHVPDPDDPPMEQSSGAARRSDAARNAEPLLINRVHTWELRPDAYTGIPNLFLAADYVRTNTDLATMEGANEAARRAVNAILEASGSSAPRCRIWNLHEPDLLALWRWRDARRYRQGLPWTAAVPGWWLALALLYAGIRRFFRR